MGGAPGSRSRPTTLPRDEAHSPKLFGNGISKRCDSCVILGGRGRDAAVAIHDGSLGLLPPLERQDGFDSGSHRRGPALVDTTCDERVKFAQKLLTEPDGNLLRGHSKSIPTWDGYR